MVEFQKAKGSCEHGEYFLSEGCPRCRAKWAGAEFVEGDIGEKLNEESVPIVKVRYFSETTGELSSREYTYYSVDRLKVGDVVMVPVRDTTGKAQVTAVDVPEAEIEAFKDKVKMIPAGSWYHYGLKVEQVMFDELSGEPAIPEAKPGDEWRAIKPLGPLTGDGPYGVQEELRAEIERDINRSDGTVSAESRIDDKVVELAEMEGSAFAVAPQDVKKDESFVVTIGSDLSWKDAREEVAIKPQEFPTAVVRIDPGNDSKVMQLLQEVMRIEEWADKLVVASEGDAKKATDDLSIMSKLKKAVDEKRREYVDPLNAHVKAVNDSFKLLTGPLDVADKTARGKVIAYKTEQERRRREAEEINRQAEELARRQAEINQGEFTVDVTPVAVPDVVKTTRTEVGSAGLVENWQYEIVDMDLLPREYMMPDSVMLNAIAKKYHDKKPIAGVRFINRPTLRVNAR